VLTKKSIVCPLLVGRASQLESLDHLIHQTQDGKGLIAHISGEAGIGKSRLIAEAKTIAQRMEFSFLEGYCFESDRNIPYAPLVDLLRTFYSMRSADESSQFRDPTTSELVKLLSELGELPPNSGSPSLNVEPEQEKRRLFESLVQFFLRMAAHAPLLVIIEDLHWSDDNTLDFLLYFARRIITQPIALFLTVRSEEAHPKLNHFLAKLNRDRHPLEIMLTHLEMNEVGVMIREILGIEQPVRADFLNALYRLTEGNPFFVEEVLKSLSAVGEFSYLDRQWDRKSIEELHIPVSIQDAVQQRVEQFDAKTRQVLTMAAVIGQRFNFALLQAMTGTDE